MKAGRKPVPPEKQAAVAAELETGRSTRDVALAFGVSQQTVNNWRAAHAQRIAAQALKLPGGRFRGIAPLRFEENKQDASAEAPPENPRIARMQERSEEQAAEPERDERTTLEQVKDLMQQSLRQSAEHSKIGRAADAQRFGRIAAVLVPVIARLERDAKTSEHTLHIPRHEITERRAKVRQRLRALVSRPLLCSACGRKLSVKWGTGKENPAAEE